MKFTRVITVAGFLLHLACSAAVIETAPGKQGGSAGEGGGGGQAPNSCGATTCQTGERCFAACADFPEPECSLGNLTCGEHDFGACGCDGNAYETLCDLDSAGIRPGLPGSCVPPAGRFACEELLCRVADQVCQINTTPYCSVREATCDNCACTDITSFCFDGGSCTDVAGGGIIVSCN